MKKCEHVFDPELTAHFTQSGCQDKMGSLYSSSYLDGCQFNHNPEFGVKQIIDSRSLFYQLNQTKSFDNNFPVAYDLIILSLKNSNRAYFSSISQDYSEKQLLLLKTHNITPLSEQLLTQNNLNKVINQAAPILLTQSSWLQNISQVLFSQTNTALQLLSIYSQLTQKKPGDFDLLGASRSLILSTGVNLPIFHSYSYSYKSEILSAIFDLASIQLALSRFPRIFLPEILGFTLAYCQLPTLVEVCFPNHQLPSSYFKFRQQIVENQAQPLLDCIRDYLELFTKHKQVLWQRIGSGFWLYQQKLKCCRDQLEIILEKPISSQQAIASLFQQKVKAAIGHHQNIQLSGKTLDSWFAGMPANSQAFLQALKQSKYVNQQRPEESLLLKLFEFKGPMFGTLNESEQIVLKDWLKYGLKDNLNEKLANTSKEPETRPGSKFILNSVRKEDLVLSESLTQDCNPSSTNTCTHVARTTQLSDKKVSQDTDNIKFSLLRNHEKLNTRELYYYLLNADIFPNVLPIAKDKIHHSLRYCAFFNPPPFKCYTHQLFDAYIDNIYKREMKAYQPMKGKPKISREAYVWAIEQLAPMILIDGCWLQNSLSLQNVSPEVSEILFSIYFDEIGNGSLEKNHPYIFQQLLDSLSIQLPPVQSTDFFKYPEFIDSAFDLPVHMLALSHFSVEFLPELLGLNMAIELSGLGKSYLNLIDEWNYWGIDSTIAKIHVSIDNYQSGHTFLAKKAIQLYLDGVIKRSGNLTILNKHWRRVYSGYASLRFVGWRFKLGLPFCYLIHQFRRKKMLFRV